MGFVLLIACLADRRADPPTSNSGSLAVADPYVDWSRDGRQDAIYSEELVVPDLTPAEVPHTAKWEATLLDERGVGYTELVQGDFDQDGVLDLAAGHALTMEVFYGPLSALPIEHEDQTRGAFGGNVRVRPVVVDVDQDGLPEVLGGELCFFNYNCWGEVAVHWPLTGEVRIWSGFVEGQQFADYVGWDYGSLGDQDGDGVVELLATTWSGSAYVVAADAPSGSVEDNATGTVAFDTSLGREFATGDLDGDGLDDLVIGGGIFLGPFVETRHATDADAAVDVSHPLLLTHPAGPGSPELWGKGAGGHKRIQDSLTDPVELASWGWGASAGDVGSSVRLLGDVDGDGWLEVSVQSYGDIGVNTYILPSDPGQWDTREDAALVLYDATNPAVVELESGGRGLVVLRKDEGSWNRPASTDWLLYDVHM